MVCTNEVEKCWLLVGTIDKGLWWAFCRYLGEGQPDRVSFDPDKIFKREDKKKDVIGFFHTHPNFQAIPSLRDIDTMEAWVTALGKPLMCLIQGIDGLKGYWFDKDSREYWICDCKRIGNLVFGTTGLDGANDE